MNIVDEDISATIAYYTSGKQIWRFICNSYFHDKNVTKSSNRKKCCSSCRRGKLNEKIRELGLQEVGHVEEDLVFGHAGTKEDATREIKLRLLMNYAAIYPEKFEVDKGTKLMQKDRKN
ncbi:unnamed protein product [Victoria cruziana]